MATTKKRQTTKTAKTTKTSRKRASPRKRASATQARPRQESRALVPEPRRFDGERRFQSRLPGREAASSVTVKNEAEALFYFERIDQRLADAWKRDVVMPEGPITIHRVVGTFFDSTHYAYVNQRLIWYLKHDASDPLGAKWEGYLKSADDAPRGTTVSFVGSDIVAKKSLPQLAEGSS